MYKIVGADQKEYGPVTEEQLRQWISEGRANGETITRFGDGPWKPLSTFPEFAALLGTVGPARPPAPLSLSGPASSSSPPATSGLAIWGLICSILGLTCCGPVFSTAGLVLSIMALSQINQNSSKYTGSGIALAGIALALVGYTVFALLLLSGVFKRAFRRFPRHI